MQHPTTREAKGEQPIVGMQRHMARTEKSRESAGPPLKITHISTHSCFQEV